MSDGVSDSQTSAQLLAGEFRIGERHAKRKRLPTLPAATPNTKLQRGTSLIRKCPHPKTTVGP